MRQDVLNIGYRKYNIIFDGNSWVAGSGSTNLNFVDNTVQQLRNRNIYCNYLNYGVAGQTIPQMQSDAVSQIDSKVDDYQILVGLEVVNTWGLSTTYTISEIYDMYLRYFLDRKSAGFKHIIALTPHMQNYYTRTAGGNWLTSRNWIVTQMKLNFPSYGIKVIDIGTDPRLWNYEDTTYFSSDKIHLNDVGQNVQAYHLVRELLKLR